MPNLLVLAVTSLKLNAQMNSESFSFLKLDSLWSHPLSLYGKKLGEWSAKHLCHESKKWQNCYFLVVFVDFLALTHVHVHFLALTDPEPVSNLSVNSITVSSVNLSWILLNGISPYFRVAWDVNLITTNQTFMQISQLAPGTKYTFNVTSVASDNRTEGRTVEISQNTSKYCREK